MSTQKQYNFKFNDDIDEEKEIIEFLESSKNKNKIVKDAINLFMILSEETGTTNPLKIMRKMSILNDISNSSSNEEKADKTPIMQRLEEDNHLSIDMNVLDSNLNDI
ncbi:MAG: hypothetical protein ACK5K7_06695 [Bacilli bacterium]